eukprot:scaffold187_cov140-Skeletonema_marinoi.AAC.3
MGIFALLPQICSWCLAPFSLFIQYISSPLPLCDLTIAETKQMNATAAGPKRSSEDDSHESIMSEKKPKLTDLPADALTSIINMANGDMKRVLDLANSNKHCLAVIKKWQCSMARCRNGIFATVEGDDGKMKLTMHDDNKIPFGCISCGENFCGACDGGNDCTECKKKECGRCFFSHMENCGACSKFGDVYCKGCQGACDEYCQLCGFSFCKHHGDKCDECDIVTCGIHDFRVDTCSFCDKGFCPRCHGHGDSMWRCESCEKYSCNAVGSEDNGCPKLVFDNHVSDWPMCKECYNTCLEEAGDPKCDECGKLSHPNHEFRVETCSYCDESLCFECQGDVMTSCDYCEKRSCNPGDGDGDTCPTFMFSDEHGFYCDSCAKEEEIDGES